MTRAQQIETVRRGAFLRAAIAAGLCAAVALALLLTGCASDADMPRACRDHDYVCTSTIHCEGEPETFVADGCAVRTMQLGSPDTIRYRKGTEWHERMPSSGRCHITYECVRPADDAK